MIHGNLVEGLIERVDGSPQEAEEAVESRREGGHAAASIVYETHSLSTDNDLGFATGWKEGQLSEQGRVLAKELGQRRLHDGIDAVFVSDLGRAVETVKIAFLDSKIPVYFDSRLRECNYGDWNGAPVAKIASTRLKYIFKRYPNGQSYTDVVGVMAGFLADLATNWGGHRVLIVGHAATRWALDHLLNGVPLEDLVDAPFNWNKGWQYTLPPDWSPGPRLGLRCPRFPLPASRAPYAPGGPKRPGADTSANAG